MLFREIQGDLERPLNDHRNLGRFVVTDKTEIKNILQDNYCEELLLDSAEEPSWKYLISSGFINSSLILVLNLILV